MKGEKGERREGSEEERETLKLTSLSLYSGSHSYENTVS